jgi:starch synthase (maltosyl-transferring)
MQNHGRPLPVERDRRRTVIERVTPSVDEGRFPIKRVVGEPIHVEADAFADGHDVLRVLLRHRLIGEAGGQPDWTTTVMRALGNDRWTATIVPAARGYVEYAVVAWVDRFASWRHELEIKVAAGDVVRSELLEGAEMVRRAADTVEALPGAAEPDEVRGRLLAAAAALREGDVAARIQAALSPALEADMAARTAPVDPVSHGPLRARIERDAAGFAAWYEMFPRSVTPDASRSGTFVDAARRLPDIAAMGFDVVYLPPIHPIGRSHRKGPNNTPGGGPADPGSPWAIGSEHGGHKSVHPDLGTLGDFERFVQAARDEGLEVALDIAFQCSPDHPYVRDHPEWFRHRPDGSIKYAENPPKKYQDIVAMDFECDAWEALWTELRDVVVFWADRGVRTFRVDNPHTKPLRFWEWLIADVQVSHPDAIFLSEAFTRPATMRWLAKAGFTQSYSYFTWRNTKAELTEYFTELSATAMREYFRPNLFANTPDILHAYLQDGGPAAFEVRLVLAATLGSLYGLYSGFELYENQPVRPGSEEYLDSEKYQIRPRDWSRRDTLSGLVARVNAIRKAHPAFRPGSRLAFHDTDNDMLICYSRESADASDRMLVVVNLDPRSMQHGFIEVPIERWGLEGAYDVRDELTGTVFHWTGARNYVRLEPGRAAAHLLAAPPPGGPA